MKSLRRAAVLMGLVIAVVAVAGWVGLRAYLSSSRAKALAADRLTQTVGLPVEVEELSVGMSSSSLKFRVLEPADGGRPGAEVLRVESATADVSLTDLAAGTVSPTELKVRGLALTVHFDQDGKLLTKLPKTGDEGGKVPAIRAEDVTLTIKQDGRPDFVLSKAALTVTPADGRIGLGGTVDDPNWGKWDVTGEVDPKPGTGKVELSTAAGPLRMDLLRSIPFVPPSTWEHVQPSGSTAAKVALERGADGKVRYDVALTPTGAARVVVSSIDADLANVAGTIKIHDAKVELADCTAALADGTVRVGGDLDFAPEPSVLKFTVAADKLDVQKLPADWNLPPRLEGRLRGKANLEVRVPDAGRVETRGGGKAVVDGAKFKGIPLSEFYLQLRGDGKRYRFESAEAPADQDKDRPKASSRANPFRGDVFFVSAVLPAAQAPQPPAPAPKKEEAKKDDAKKDEAKKEETEPTTLDATVALRDIDIAELLTKLEIKIPYRLGGRVSIRATVTIPLAQADNLRTYRVVGTVASPEARFEDATVRDFSARMVYAEGVLKLTELRGTMPKPGGGSPGAFSGTATAAVEPRGDLSAALTLDRVPLGEAVKAVPGGGPALRGDVTGKAEFRAPIDKMSDTGTWVASADVSGDELGVFGRIVRAAVVRVKVDRGTATLAAARGVVEGLPLDATGTIGLARPYKFDAAVKTSPLDVADVRKLVPELELPFEMQGKLETSAKVAGTASPFALTASGSAKASDLKIGPSEANAIAFKWDLDGDRVRVADLVAELFRGTVTGSADVPLDTTKGGKFALAFKDLDSALATKALSDFPVRLTGRVSGKFSAAVPAAKPGQPRAIAADLDLTAPKMTVQGVPAERLTGKVTIGNGSAAYVLEGRALGGTFEVKGRYPSRKAAPAAPGAPPVVPAALLQDPPKDERGSIRFRDLDLSRLADVFKVESLRLLGGRLDLSADFAGDLSEGSGRLAVRDLAWGRDRLASSLVGSIRVDDGMLFLTDFAGTFAGGSLRGRGRLSMTDPGRNFFVINIDRADAQRLFAPAPGLADGTSGQVSVVLRGRLGAETRGSGQLSFDRGSLFGLNATDLRIPFDWVAGTGGAGQVIVREAVANVGHGRLVGEVTYDWGVTGRLSGNLRFQEVRLQGLVGESRLFGNGRITGRFDFGGSNVRSADDVSGTLNATLNQASVQELPIFRQLVPYLSPAEAVRPFQAGEVRGRLARGVFRIDRLAMSNPSTQLFAEGNVTLAGRLDLDVVATTGRVGIDDRAMRLLGLRLPAFGPVPITLLRDVSDLLSNRTVRLHVTGTVNNPSVSVNTAALLSDEAVRFLLARYVPVVATGGVAGLVLPDNREQNRR